MTAPNARQCPPESVLSDFGLGKLDANSADTISQHIETCADCRQRVAGLSGDTFVGRLRKAGDAAGESADSSEQERSPGDRSNRGRSLYDLSAPPELANHPDYELIKELGQGGMGTVYLAKNRMMDRPEVLKVISKALLDRPGALERFQQEIRAAAKLNHSNIVAAYSVLRPGDLLVFAMEYVKGQDLSEVVKARGPLPVTNAAFYIHQVANGLQHAFEKGMVHRDIKPNNLMLAIEGKKHTVKILDFGLAKATSEKSAEGGLTKSGQMLGTPDYVAPEQTLDAHNADIRADIYSLGCTLYFLLSGGPPFEEQSLYAILEAHHKREPKPLNLVRPEVPVELAAVVSKMMAKDPAKRYQTPIEVARALVPFFKPGQSVAPPSEKPAGEEYPPHPVETAPPPQSITPPSFDGQPAPLSLPGLPLPVAMGPVPLQPPPASDDLGVSINVKRPAIRRRSGWSSLPPWQRWTALGGAAAALLLGIVLLVRTPRGTIEIELSDPDAKVTVAVDGNRVDIAGLDAPLTLEVGEHEYTVKGNGFETRTTRFQVTRGKNAPLTVKLAPKPVPQQTAKDVPKIDLTPVGSAVADSQSATAHDTPPMAPPDAQEFGGHLYKFYETQLTWKAARDRCQALGGQLVVIDSLAENSFVGGLVEKAAWLDAWIGATDEAEEGKWRDVDGQPLRFTNWGATPGKPKSKQPNNKNNEEHYAIMSNRWFKDGSVAWSWSDQPNNSKEARPGYVCEWKPSSSVSLSPHAPASTGEDFFASNAKKEGVKTLASGLQYKVLNSGNGPSPTEADTVEVHYRGTLLDGTEFDNSYRRGTGVSIPLNKVINGWAEALPLMKVGDKWQLFVPPGLAYGAQGTHDKDGKQKIPPNAALIFDIELLDVAGNGPLGKASTDSPPLAIGPFDADQARAHQEAWAKHLGAPVEQTNSIGMKLILVPPGEFTMGSAQDEIDKLVTSTTNDFWRHNFRSEAPRHRVNITHPFYLSSCEVTQGQYLDLIGRNPSHFSLTGPGSNNVRGIDTSQHPVELVSWFDAIEFCNKLSAKEQLPLYYRRNGDAIEIQGGDGYRLPTEAEWEHACRAGTTTRWYFGDNETDLAQAAWLKPNSDHRTHQVGTMSPNPFGLYDLFGNVFEWCNDSHEMYSAGAASDPTVSVPGAFRALRGGGFVVDSSLARSAYRDRNGPSNKTNFFGFRVARTDGQSRGDDSGSTKTFSADRRAAEYVLSVGGKIKINGQLDGLSKWQGDVREINNASDLPDGPFRLSFIDLNVSRGVTEAGMKALQGTKHLHEIVIDGCTGITDASLANLKDNRQLKSLHLYRTKISAAGLRHFKECSELNWLYLGMWSAFGDEDMEFFKEFSGLSSLGMLWLHGTSVGDAGLAYLKGANKLCQLNLNGTKITDNGLRALEKHPKIMYLHLHDNSAIGDAGLVWLRECHGLRHLNLNNTKVTADGAKSLKRALPDCKILWGGGEVALNEANADSGSSNSDSGVKPAAAAAPSQASSPADSTALPRGRYVRIELPRTGTLSLAEVEAYSGGRNLARSGKATQKSTGYGGHASRVIDGNTSGSYDDGGASHTGNDISEPWWEVDLGDVYPLENIVVHNRTDGDFEKWLSGFTLLVLDADRRVVAKRMGIPAPMPSARFDVKDLLTGVEPAPVAKLTAKEAFTLKQHTGAVTRVAFHRTMPALASAGKDGRVLVWNLKNPRAQALETHKFNEEVWAVKFSPEGAVLALANRNYWGSRLFFKTLTGQKLNEIKDFKGAQSAVASIAYSPDGRLFAAGLDNGTIRLWDGAQFRELSPVGLGTGHAAHSLAFGPITSDRKSRSVEYLLAEGGQDGAARTLTATFAAGQWTFGPTPVEFPKGAAITGVRFSRDGKLLGFTRVGGHVCLCDAGTGQALRDLSGGSRNGDAAESIAFHPEMPWCVTGHKSAQAARIWNVETAELLAELKGHTGGVMCAEFSPDGRQVATASEDFSIKVWDLSGGNLPEVAKKGKKAKPPVLVVGD